MQTDPSPSSSGPLHVGSVAALWRYPVKSMMGEELNSSEVTGRGLLGDRQFAVVDRSTGKVRGGQEPAQVGQLLRLPGRLRPAARGRRDDAASPDHAS